VLVFVFDDFTAAGLAAALEDLPGADFPEPALAERAEDEAELLAVFCDDDCPEAGVAAAV